jgi:Domain of unknown function (DUF3387)
MPQRSHRWAILAPLTLLDLQQQALGIDIRHLQRLTEEEIAFYDALADNESARQVMGEPTLRPLAQINTAAQHALPVGAFWNLPL